jgi:hypothetical protein
MQRNPVRIRKVGGRRMIAGAVLVGSLVGLAPAALAAQAMEPERCSIRNFPCGGCWYC